MVRLFAVSVSGTIYTNNASLNIAGEMWLRPIYGREDAERCMATEGGTPVTGNGASECTATSRRDDIIPTVTSEWSLLPCLC